MGDFTSKQHPTDDALELFSMGRLASHEQEPVEEHLLVCESCRNRVQAFDQYTGVMRTALRRVGRDPEPSHRSIWAAILNPSKPALALVAACAVLLIVIPAVRRPARTAQTIELAALRGGAETTARAGAPLDLRLPAEGLESHAAPNIEVVDAVGTRQWTGIATLESGKWRVAVGRSLSRGIYFVRAYAPDTSELLREYPLQVQ